MDSGSPAVRMTVNWVNEMLEDFSCALDDSNEDELLNKLIHLGRLYNLSNEDLIDELAAFHSNQKKPSVTYDTLQTFETKVLAGKKKSDTTAQFQAPSSSKRSVFAELSIRPELAIDIGDDDALLCDGMGSGNKSERRFKVSPSNSPTGSKNVKTSFSMKTFKPFTPQVPRVLPRLNVISDIAPESYLYGNDKTQQLVTELYEEESLANPPASETTGSSTTLSGRLFPAEGEIVDGTNAMLVSPSLSVRLDLNKLEQCSLYPGKPVLVRGFHNENRFVVDELIEGTAPALAKMGANYLQQIRLVVASGPYFSTSTSSDNFLAKIIDEALRSNANALVLVGPFIDKNQQNLVVEVDIEQIMRAVSERVRNSKLLVLVVPYVARDLAAVPYFPTPPYELASRGYGIAQNVKLLPDPAVFEVEGVRVAVNASEILVHLSRTERSWSPHNENEDRMTRLISHIFRAQSLYPFYSLDPRNVPFNAHNSRKHLRLEKTPHVLILPSFINPMIKVVDNCVCVNPGRLVMGASAGTFARVDIDVASAAASKETAQTIVPHSCVEIVAMSSAS